MHIFTIGGHRPMELQFHMLPLALHIIPQFFDTQQNINIYLLFFVWGLAPGTMYLVLWCCERAARQTCAQRNADHESIQTYCIRNCTFAH